MNLSDKEKQNALNEVRILASIRHPNVVQYKEAFIEENSNSLWSYFITFSQTDSPQKHRHGVPRQW